MALRAKTGDIPENAVILTKREAIKYQWKQIMDWKPRKEVWPFIHGVGFLGGLAGLTGLYINLRFRNVMKMKNFGNFAAAFTTTLSPAVLACVAQMKIADETLLPIDTCPICVELKAVVTQNVCAIVYPVILTPITNFMLALRGQTHRIPYYKNWRELLLFCGSLYKPIIPAIGALTVINTAAASFIIYKQFNSVSYIRQIASIDEESKKNDEMDYLL